MEDSIDCRVILFWPIFIKLKKNMSPGIIHTGMVTGEVYVSPPTGVESETKSCITRNL